MRLKWLVSVCLFLSYAAFAVDEHPLASAKKGDWAEYTVIGKMGGLSFKNEQREAVHEKTGDLATVVVSMKDNPQISQPYTCKLGEKFDPFKLMRPSEDFTATETGKGEEELEVGGRKLKTVWKTYDEVYTVKGVKLAVKSKIWIASGVPLGGVVRIEIDQGAAGKKVKELTGYGGQ